MNVDRYMKLARCMAKTSTFKRQKMGSVIVYKKTVISSAANSYKTHPLQKEYNILRFDDDSCPHYLHAEMAALIPLQNLNIDWSKVHLFTYRVMRSRKSGYARPCRSCMKYIKSLGIKNIYYSTDNGYNHEILQNEDVIKND